MLLMLWVFHSISLMHLMATLAHAGQSYTTTLGCISRPSRHRLILAGERGRGRQTRRWWMDRSTHCRYAQLAVLCMPLINISILVSAGQEEVVNELVGAGTDVNRKNDRGITPLFVSRAHFVGLFTQFMALQTLCSVKVTY